MDSRGYITSAEGQLSHVVPAFGTATELLRGLYWRGLGYWWYRKVMGKRRAKYRNSLVLLLWSSEQWEGCALVGLGDEELVLSFFWAS